MARANSDFVSVSPSARGECEAQHFGGGRNGGRPSQANQGIAAPYPELKEPPVSGRWRRASSAMGGCSRPDHEAVGVFVGATSWDLAGAGGWSTGAVTRGGGDLDVLL